MANNTTISTEKAEILKMLFSASVLYKENLLNNNMLVVYQTGPNKYECIEILFEARHFQHLTGAKTSNDILAADFFNRCLDKRLSVDDFELADDGTTPLKMSIIERLMKIQFVSTMIGTYDGNRPRLVTDKLMGDVRGCMGFVQEGTNYYAPNTLIKADIRDEVTHYDRVICVYLKKKQASLYNRLCYVAPNIDRHNLRFSQEILAKVDLENLQDEALDKAPKKKKKKIA